MMCDIQILTETDQQNVKELDGEYVQSLILKYYGRQLAVCDHQVVLLPL